MIRIPDDINNVRNCLPDRPSRNNSSQKSTGEAANRKPRFALVGKTLGTPCFIENMAGPTRLELATSCVTDKSTDLPNYPLFQSNLKEIKGLNRIQRMCLTVCGRARLIAGYPQKSPHTISNKRRPGAPKVKRTNGVGRVI